ncbi:hypothetical protein H0H81_011858, partial [Sphagnurus paluster]
VVSCISANSSSTRRGTTRSTRPCLMPRTSKTAYSTKTTAGSPVHSRMDTMRSLS